MSPLNRSHALVLAVLMVLPSACLDLADDFQLDRNQNLPDVGADLGGFPTGPPLPWSGNDVRIATYNLRLFFDPICDSGNCDPEDFEEAPTEAAFAARADTIAAAIRALDADIVLLQEIESRICLDALLLRLADRYRTGVLGGSGGGDIDVAVLANGEILEEVRHGDTVLTGPSGPESFTREFLEVHLALSGDAMDADLEQVIVFVGHFKAKLNDDPDRRLAEASGAHAIVVDVARQYDEQLVVFGGDLNDFPGSPPLDALESDGQLLRVAAELPEAAQNTFGNQAIDHLFFAVDGAGDYETGSAGVFREGAGWGDSDHGALVANFDFDFEPE